MEYIPRNVAVGNPLTLRCNTSLTPGITWTHDIDNNDGYVDNVYPRDVAKPGVSASSSTPGVHRLLLKYAKLTDSGRYDCYDDQGLRIVGYQVIVNGIFYTLSLRLFTFIYLLHYIKTKPDGKSSAKT